MPSNLRLAIIVIFVCFFFLFRVAFKHFFTTPVDIENTKLKLLAAIPTDSPIKVTRDAMEMLRYLQIKQLKIYQKY